MAAGLAASLFPFLASLSADGRRELAALATTRVLPGQRLLARGEPSNGAYFVVGGALRVYYITDEGREATLYRVEPGGLCVLALSSTLNELPYPAWVNAGATGGAFLRVPPEPFHRLLDSERAFRTYVMASITGRIFELMQTLEELGSTQVEQRVARYLLRRHSQQPASAVRVTQAGIASELGTAREVVFRALRALAAEHLIATGRASIQILDPAGLKRAAKLDTR